MPAVVHQLGVVLGEAAIAPGAETKCKREQGEARRHLQLLAGGNPDESKSAFGGIGNAKVLAKGRNRYTEK